MKWFGPEKFARVCDDVERAAPPIGEKCIHCDEAIGKNDAGFLIPCVSGGASVAPYHQECFLRGISGSVGHQLHDCECYGAEDVSERGLTRREAARLARDFYESSTNAD